MFFLFSREQLPSHVVFSELVKAEEFHGLSTPSPFMDDQFNIHRDENKYFYAFSKVASVVSVHVFFL